MSEIQWIDHGVIPTNDLGRAILFYTQVLGAEIDSIANVSTEMLRGGVGGRSTMRCFVKLGANELGLFLQSDQLPKADGLTGAPCYEWEMSESELDRAVASLAEHRVPYEGPIEGPPGYPLAKQVFFNDPDDNHVALCVVR